MIQTFSEAASQGTLWFPVQLVTDRIPLPIGATIETTRPLLDPNDGDTDSGAISIVARIRNGGYEILSENTSIGTDVGPSEWQYITTLSDNRGDLLIGGHQDGDIIEIDYFTPPTEPTVGQAEDDQNAAGSLTPFFFRGRTNFDLVDPAMLTTQERADIRVSATADNFFDTEILFEVVGDIPAPVPGTDTAYTDNTIPSTREALYFTGNEIQHWLRDENERIVLFGALAEAFAYLQEEDMHQKYKQMFTEQIALINGEEKMRVARGGNLSVSFNGNGLI